MQKKIIFVFIFVLSFMILGLSHNSHIYATSQNIKIYINDSPLVTSSSPFAEKGVTLVPMRAIFETLGAKVVWSPETQTIIAKKEATNITLILGKTIAFIDTNKQSLALPPKIKDGTTYVPLRFISEGLGANVEWDKKEQKILIHTTKKETLVESIARPSDASKKELSVQEIGKKENAVVCIYNTQTDGSEYLGSGFIISEDGKIATNYHVIANAQKLSIALDNDKQYSDISILGYDAKKDIAVIKINSNDKFPYCKLGNSDNVVLGDSIVVIGNPMGYINTLSTGIISSLKQQGYIQITAPISPGSSGGALFNMYGEVIGISSSGVLAGENLGFCIPINELKKLSLDKLLTPAAFYQQENRIKTPSNVKAFALSSDEIALQWDNDTAVDYYYVYYSDTPNGKFIPFLDENGNNSEFPWSADYSMTNYGLNPRETVYYKVIAVKDHMMSPYSQMVSATTFASDNSDALINIVKQGEFDVFPNQQVGTAFEAFFDSPKWSYFYSADNKKIVEFSGMCSYGSENASILLQFEVFPSSKAFEAIYMERNNKPMPSSEFNELLDSIFQK